MKGGKRCGFGVGIYRDKIYYIGQWLDDRYDGAGLFHDPSDTCTYIGYRKQYTCSGYGALIYDSGATIEGQFTDDYSCEGVVTLKSGVKHEGSIKKI